MKYELIRKDFPNYTDDEKELLDLIRKLKKFYNHLKPTEEKHKNIIAAKITELDNLETGVKSFDAKRREFNSRLEDSEKPKRQEIHKMDCPKCKTFYDQMPYGEMINEKGWRVFTYYCKRCKIEFGDFYPIESKDQLTWIDNFINKSLLVRDDDTTYAEKFSMTSASIEQMKKDRKDIARHAKEMEAWKAPHLKYVAECETWVSAWVKQLNERLEETIQAGDDENEKLKIIDRTFVRRVFEDTYYSDDEREIIALHKYFENYYQNITGKEKMLDEMYKGLTEGMTGMRIQLENFVKDRFNFEVDLEMDKFNDMNKLYDVDCTHCNQQNSVRPLGEKLNERGWRCYYFLCTGCGKEFFDFLPNKEEDKLAYLEDFIQQANTILEDGRPYKEHHGIPESMVIDFTQQAATTKEHIIKVKEAHAGMKRIHEEQKLRMKEGIGFLTLQKMGIESGGQAVGES